MKEYWRALLLSNFFFVFFAWTGLETGFYSGLLGAANEAEREAYPRSRNPDLVLLPGQPGAPAQSPRMIYGLAYDHAHTFPQGSDETWELYERRKQAHP